MLSHTIGHSRSWSSCREQPGTSSDLCRPLLRPARRGEFRRPARPYQRQATAASLQESPQFRPEVEEGAPHSPLFPSSPFGRNIVVAVDSTEESVNAFRWTLLNIYRHGDVLHVLHIMPDHYAGPATGSIYYCPPDEPEAERCLWSQVQEFIEDNFVAAGRRQGIEVQVVLVKEKHRGVGRAICRKAEELRASPLILAAHTKGPVEELLMGSTAKFCVSHCKQPVLLLHDE